MSSCYRLKKVIESNLLQIIKKLLIMEQWKSLDFEMTTLRKRVKSYHGIRLSSPLTAEKHIVLFLTVKKLVV